MYHCLEKMFNGTHLLPLRAGISWIINTFHSCVLTKQNIHIIKNKFYSKSPTILNKWYIYIHHSIIHAKQRYLSLFIFVKVLYKFICKYSNIPSNRQVRVGTTQPHVFYHNSKIKWFESYGMSILRICKYIVLVNYSKICKILKRWVISTKLF